MNKETYLDPFGNIITLKWVKTEKHQPKEEKKKAEVSASAGNQPQD